MARPSSSQLEPLLLSSRPIDQVLNFALASTFLTAWRKKVLCLMEVPFQTQDREMAESQELKSFMYICICVWREVLLSPKTLKRSFDSF